jgi:hypothetical protein
VSSVRPISSFHSLLYPLPFFPEGVPRRQVTRRNNTRKRSSESTSLLLFRHFNKYHFQCEISVYAYFNFSLLPPKNNRVPSSSHPDIGVKGDTRNKHTVRSTQLISLFSIIILCIKLEYFLYN